MESTWVDRWWSSWEKDINGNNVGDRTETWGTLLLYRIYLKDLQWPFATVTIERLERKLERRIDTDRGML